MKKQMFIAALAAVCLAGINNEATAAKMPVVLTNNQTVMATPPAAVLAAFQARFGNVAVRQWKLRSNGNWRAHFMRNGIAWEATFTPAGMLVKSEPA